MKKLQILLPMAAVLLSLTGCKKDNEKSGPSGETVTLSATLGGGEKTEIDGLNMKWSEGDKVNINGTPYTATFPLDDGTYTQASFVGVERAEDGKYYAYYPASIYRSNIEGVLPSTQTYHPENGNKLSDISPMYAVTETTELQFHNICALVKLEVTGEGTVKKIVVSSDNNLCGTFTVVENSGKYHAEISEEGGKTVTLKCGTGVALSATTPTTFYIALPQGALGNLTFKIGKSTSAAVNANLTAGKLYAKSMSDVVVVSTPGALDGEFTINEDGDKVNFSQGNLQATYNGSKYTWAFAENQYDYVGNAAGNTTINNQQSGNKVDLFGWTAAEKYNDGIKQYGINTSTLSPSYGSALDEACCDWGSLIGAGWRTLTREELIYLFKTRATDYGSDNRYAEVKVNGKAGILLFPDDFSSWPAGAGKEPTTFNAVSSDWNGVDYTVAQFNVLQTADCVFLPAAGSRSGTSVSSAGDEGYSWSSTPKTESDSFSLFFRSNFMSPALNYPRSTGRSVRLVLPVEN